MSMEYFEVLTENGERTGIKKSRDEVLRDGDWHEVASVWLLSKNGEMLIQQRSESKKVNPLKWTLFTGGHIEYGEDAKAAAIREVWEEVGIKLEKQDLKYIKPIKIEYQIKNLNINVKEIKHEYIVILDGIDIEKVKLAIDLEEVADVRLVPIIELERMIKDKSIDCIIDIEADEMMVEIKIIVSDYVRLCDTPHVETAVKLSAN